MASTLTAALLFFCSVALAGIWLVVAEIRTEVRRLVRDYERSLVKDVRSRVQ